MEFDTEDQVLFRLLPNRLSSNYWNQYWVKEVLTNVFKYLGYGQGGIPYGSGPLPRGYPEDFIIPYDKFTGPGGKPPADFKGNYKEVLHQLLIALLEEHDIDGESHVCDPPLGKWIPKSQRGNGVENDTTKKRKADDDGESAKAKSKKSKTKKVKIVEVQEAPEESDEPEPEPEPARIAPPLCA